MTKDNLIIGHYASHTNTGNFDINKHRVIFEHNKSVREGEIKPQPSERELRIRKEVMDDVNKMIEYEADEEEYHKSILLRIKDRLNLLWGKNDNL